MDKYLFVIDLSDFRGIYIKQGLSIDGYETCSLEDAKQDSDKKKVYVFSLAKDIDIKIVDTLSRGSILFGRITKEFVKEYIKQRGIEFYGFLDDEIFVVKNAYLTAEGALMYIIQNTDITIRQMPVLILGYGRVGKSLSKLFNDNYAIVSVATNNKIELAEASIFAHRVYSLSEVSGTLHEYKAIINTIPQKILKGEILKLIDKDSFVLDLASKPGGLDYEKAEEYGLNFLHALGVPGKTSPKTAGLYLKESILRRLND